MRDWKETEHPRDEDGKFTAKGGGKTYRQNEDYRTILDDIKTDTLHFSAEKKKINEIKQNDNLNIKLSQNEHNKVEKVVFERLSTHRKEIENEGYVKITVYTWNYCYTVKINNLVGDFEVIKKWKNK